MNPKRLFIILLCALYAIVLMGCAATYSDDEIESIKESAYDDGYSAGHKEALQEAEDEYTPILYGYEESLSEIRDICDDIPFWPDELLKPGSVEEAIILLDSRMSEDNLSNEEYAAWKEIVNYFYSGSYQLAQYESAQLEIEKICD